MNISIRLLRLFFALLILSAVIGQFYFKFNIPGFNIVSFFSYFTILSNIFAAFVLFILTIRPHIKHFEKIRGASVFYMTITGVVYAVLLSRYEGTPGLMLPFANLIFHKIMPIVMVLDWIIIPIKKKITYKTVFPWLIFPLAFLFYSEIRGKVVNWYPYPFLNPETAGGYMGVTLYSIGILLFAFLLGLLLVKIGNARSKK